MPGVLAHWLVVQEVVLRLIRENKNIYKYFASVKKPGDYFEEDEMVKVIGDGLKGPQFKEMENTEFSKMQRNPSKEDVFISKYAYLGASGPDVPYFYHANLNDFWKVGKSKWADLLHYNNQTNFIVELIRAAKGITDDKEKDKERYRLLNYALGHITHLAVDAIIHPYINLFAGVYHDQVYWKDNVRPLPDESIHKIVECHQDSWIARAYFGHESVKGNGIWKKYIPPLSFLGGDQAIVLSGETKNVLDYIDKAIGSTYGEKPGLEYLKDSFENFYDPVITFYETAFNIPEKYNPALVQHDSLVGVDYTILLTEKAVKAAFNACECLINLYDMLTKIDMSNSNAKEQEQRKVIEVFKSKVKNYNMDTGYRVEVTEITENGKTHPRIIWRHSWCE